MNDEGNAILLEDGTGFIMLEDGPNGVLLLESSPQNINFNNYEFVSVGDGMSVGGDKIR